MKRSVFVAVAAALVTASDSGAGDPGTPPDAGAPSPSSPARSQEALAHGVPSVGSTTYDVVDTMMMSLGSPAGTTELLSVATATLSVRFRDDPVGLRVNAEIEDFSGFTRNRASGSTRSLQSRDARGAMVFVVGSTGGVMSVARPELSRDAGQLSLFNQLPYDLFPGLPGRVADPGETWSDTVVWYSSAGGMETTSTTARTYTLVGDTVVDGLALVAIALSAEVAIGGQGRPGGRATTNSLSGSLTGHLFWDAESGLLHSAELMRRLEGRATMEGRPSTSVRFSGPQRLRREK
ncbi:MAG: hypothetical protein OXQ94_16140 [Gemmatimonadota bacterium]|nr:hypothetical protein [Gemmatimonadota bacterium]MDE2873209.1 hypothetical protein [Gemmatimonadota bacterium]